MEMPASPVGARPRCQTTGNRGAQRPWWGKAGFRV